MYKCLVPCTNLTHSKFMIDPVYFLEATGLICLNHDVSGLSGSSSLTNLDGQLDCDKIGCSIRIILAHQFWPPVLALKAWGGFKDSGADHMVWQVR